MVEGGRNLVCVLCEGVVELGAPVLFGDVLGIRHAMHLSCQVARARRDAVLGPLAKLIAACQRSQATAAASVLVTAKLQHEVRAARSQRATARARRGVVRTVGVETTVRG
jgi:hypothetical protein